MTGPIETGWEQLAATMPEPFPPAARQLARHYFYAGAVTVLDAILSAADDSHSAVRVATRAMMAECVEFSKRYPPSGEKR